jgi:LPXTG-motif cell wall-anchored protein
MKTVRLALATAVVAAAALFAATSPAQAAYSAIIELTVSPNPLVGGGNITATATTQPTTDCDEISITYEGETVTGTGSTLTHVFDTKVVDKVTETLATATCIYDDDQFKTAAAGGALKLGSVLVADTQETHDSVIVTLLPKSGEKPDDGGILPNTGGERLAWLVIGGLLVLVGGGVVIASRRRSA